MGESSSERSAARRLLVAVLLAVLMSVRGYRKRSLNASGAALWSTGTTCTPLSG